MAALRGMAMTSEGVSRLDQGFFFPVGHVADLACWAYAGGMNPDS